MLTAHDPLPATPARVLVAGNSGAGKTTLCARIAALLDLPRIELDALHHGPGWTPRPEFAADVEAFSTGPEWVTEWQYGAVRPLLAERADLLVWLDLPRTTVMRRVTARTLRRRIRRERLWNGNIEPPLRTIFVEPDHIVRFAWRTHGTSARRVRDLAADPPESLHVVRLRSPREVDTWVAGPLRAVAPH
ncbi:AAA family ATPase [Rhodococcus triatomae]|uniref:Adenylate kinase n=1 Tax=Rhodococcus triatomae TaxID=300028 RepID=A0A1G8FC33_9NOCA|nr:AAA family ATPase [Rhodococcus triatomae]QNG21411.1 AAA family ATPase [Rhodococcus triatomae]QNG25849.1 AAA family ATPase [Rhodococcus triatomae]SDH79622.1 Adenylate kinase [Rhodococcus triatomae]